MGVAAAQSRYIINVVGAVNVILDVVEAVVMGAVADVNAILGTAAIIGTVVVDVATLTLVSIHTLDPDIVT